MLPKYLYNPDNVDRSRYAQIGVIALAVVLCGYAFIVLSLDMRALKQSKSSLAQLKLNEKKLMRQSKGSLKDSLTTEAATDAGVERFAADVAGWAKARRVQIESLTPEGSPGTVDVKIEDTPLGQWTSQTLRVQGRGQLNKVMELLDQLRNPIVPSELKSFSLQALNNGSDGSVTFQLVLTVYEKKRGVS